jgi:hypothetical protein
MQFDPAIVLLGAVVILLVAVFVGVLILRRSTAFSARSHTCAKRIGGFSRSGGSCSTRLPASRTCWGAGLRRKEAPCRP